MQTDVHSNGIHQCIEINISVKCAGGVCMASRWLLSRHSNTSRTVPHCQWADPHTGRHSAFLSLMSMCGQIDSCQVFAQRRTILSRLPAGNVAMHDVVIGFLYCRLITMSSYDGFWYLIVFAVYHGVGFGALRFIRFSIKVVGWCIGMWCLGVVVVMGPCHVGALIRAFM